MKFSLAVNGGIFMDASYVCATSVEYLCCYFRRLSSGAEVKRLEVVVFNLLYCTSHITPGVTAC